MAKRTRKRTLIVETRPIDPPDTDPVAPLETEYVEAQPARIPVTRDVIAEEIRRRREEIARSMAEAEAEVIALVDRAQLDYETRPTRQVAVLAENPWPADPGIATAAEAVAEAMRAATMAVEATNRAIDTTESFLHAEAAAGEQSLISEAMRAAERSVADSVRAAGEGVAAAEGAASDVVGE